MRSDLVAFLIWLTLWVASIAGFINHVIICVREDHYLLLFAGILIPPVGVIHGLGGFFGVWN
jgi:hypothetical protein